MKRFGTLVFIVVAFSLIQFGSASAAISSLTLDSKADLSDNRASAVVTGTIICTPNPAITDDATISVIVTQSSGQVDVAGQGFVTVDCTGTVQSWAVVVNVVTAPAFKHGPAVALFGASDADGSFPTQSQGIKL